MLHTVGVATKNTHLASSSIHATVAARFWQQLLFYDNDVLQRGGSGNHNSLQFVAV